GEVSPGVSDVPGQEDVGGEAVLVLRHLSRDELEDDPAGANPVGQEAMEHDKVHHWTGPKVGEVEEQDVLVLHAGRQPLRVDAVSQARRPHDETEPLIRVSLLGPVQELAPLEVLGVDEPLMLALHQHPEGNHEEEKNAAPYQDALASRTAPGPEA